MKRLAVALAWVLVAVPLGWGLWRSVAKARPLFTGVVPATNATPSPGTLPPAR